MLVHRGADVHNMAKVADDWLAFLQQRTRRPDQQRYNDCREGQKLSAKGLLAYSNFAAVKVNGRAWHN